MGKRQIIIEDVTDPEEIRRFRVQNERARRNSEWLQTHWPELVQRARGRHVAVAGQEAFIADTADEAYALAAAAHPDDDGLLLKYVRVEQGPRIYAHHR